MLRSTHLLSQEHAHLEPGSNEWDGESTDQVGGNLEAESPPV